ncbi:MAG: type II toxin-antitoxin system HicA family toxin [Firmicutes bacterium]|nr:type II toxin-antitoxin system HicA family toxin [Bacillota bacterium]
MASVKKIVDKMKRQPNGIRFDEAKKVLEHNGYKITSQKGSHRVFRDATGDQLSVPEKKPTIDKQYVAEILLRHKE